MSYSLIERSDGQVDLLRTERRVVGTFAEADIALEVLSFLSDPDRAETAAPQPEMPTAASGIRAPDKPVGFAPQGDDTPAGQPVAASSSPTVNLPVPAATDAAAATLTSKELDAAFQRIRDGEKVALVAADIGIGMGSLRSKWANHNRYLNATLNHENAADCIICGKAFQMTANNLDQCARCAND